MDRITAYLPPDRYRALALGTTLPEHAEGAVLFADIAGFTALTEGLLLSRGQRPGAEELADRLNEVYTAVIGEVDRAGGSVISFSGDAITAWFAQDAGQRAISCALAIQGVMQPFAGVALAVKVAIVCGPARRYLVGDEAYGLIDVLAGATIDRLAALEQAARPGEVLLDEATAQRWSGQLEIGEWRPYDQGAGRAAVVRSWRSPADEVAPLPDPPALDEARLRPWLAPAVWARFQAGQGEFLTELRPAIALFLRFTGLAYESDPAAAGQLDRFVRWVQQVAAQFGGTLLQLTIGDKGSYAYVCFGAPVAYDDDPIRAVRAAERLRTAPAEHDCIQTIQIGLSSGIMRTGAYGAPHRRTYGALGDGVNVAARLMVLAEPGQVLADAALVERVGGWAAWEPLAPVALKGKAARLDVYSLAQAGAASRAPLQVRSRPSPLVGRASELAALDAALEAALAGAGRIIGLIGEAGIGKSRLIEEWAGRAAGRGLTVYQGAASSYGLQTPYLVWQPIWQDFFGLDGDLPSEQVGARLAAVLAEFDPDFPLRAPLLGPVLNTALPDTDFTREFDAKLRKQSREALLVESLRMRARRQSADGSGTVIILEDAHGIDALSHELLESIGRVLDGLPVLIVLVARPPQSPEQPWPDPARLERFESLRVAEFSQDEALALGAATLAGLGYAEVTLAPAVIAPLMERTRGNPFYLEEVLHYLHAQGADPRRAEDWPAEPLPLSLQSVILSRVDHLPATHQSLLKTASIIGLLFAADWLCGYYPGLGSVESVGPELDALCERHLLRWIAADPTYAFHHGLTQEVLYASLPAATRARLHERLGDYLEAALGTGDPQVSLLAYHYGRSANQAKKRHYLRRAGDLAAAAYANDAAIAAYEELLPLLADPAERGEVLHRLGAVFVLVGRWDDARLRHEQALELAVTGGDEDAIAQGKKWIGLMLIRIGKHREAIPLLEQVAERFLALKNLIEYYKTISMIGNCLFHLGEYQQALLIMEGPLSRARADNIPIAIASLTNTLGNVFKGKGQYPTAQVYYDESLVISQEIHNMVAVAITLNNLAIVVCEQGNYQLAQTYYERSLKISHQTGDKLGACVTLNNLLSVSYALNDYTMAQENAEEALRIAQELGAKPIMISILSNLGLMAFLRGELHSAKSFNEEAMGLAQEIGDQRSIVIALINLSDIYREEGAIPESLLKLLESIDLANSIGYMPMMPYAFVRMAAVIAVHSEESARDALRLAGWVGRYLNTSGVALEPYDQGFLDRTVSAVREVLTEAEFSELWAAGAAMSLDEAVAISRAWAETPL